MEDRKKHIGKWMRKNGISGAIGTERIVSGDDKLIDISSTGGFLLEELRRKQVLFLVLADYDDFWSKDESEFRIIRIKWKDGSDIKNYKFQYAVFDPYKGFVVEEQLEKV